MPTTAPAVLRSTGRTASASQALHHGLAGTAGGAQRSWHGWRRDGTPSGIDVGNFDTAEEAMTAVDAAG